MSQTEPGNRERDAQSPARIGWNPTPSPPLPLPRIHIPRNVQTHPPHLEHLLLAPQLGLRSSPAHNPYWQGGGRRDGVPVHDRCYLRRQQGEGRDPEDDGEDVKGQDRPVVVAIGRTELHDNGIDGDDQGRNSLE